MIKTQFNGQEISLYMSGGAMFELDAIRLAWNDGHVEPVLGVQELLMDLDSERLQILAQVVEILERAALAAKRALGQDEFPVIPAAQILALAKPRDLPILTNAALRAIIDGFKTDAGNDKSVDVFMLENLKKKTDPSQEPLS